MLIRSEFFLAMFSSGFREAQETPHLQIIPIDCSPAVLEIVLQYLYTESATIPLSLATDVLFAADLLFIERLKQRAAVIISTLGNGSASTVESVNPRGEIKDDAEDPDALDIIEVVRAGWDTRVQRLEEFGARYMAYRLERYIDTAAFAELVKDSAQRVKGRQETDTVELVDDIRYYLSERFRLRFEDTGIEEWMDENAPASAARPLSEGIDPEFADVIPTANFDAPAEALSNMSLNDAQRIQHVETKTDSKEQYTPELMTGEIRTLDGEIAGDEFAQDAMNYQILLGKIDRLMEQLGLDG